MNGHSDFDVICRDEGNPLIRLGDLPFRCGDIWNAGIVRFEGRYLMLLTIETLQGRYCIYKALSDDGCRFEVEPEPWLAPSDDGRGEYETVGVRDPRITAVDGEYFICYVADGDHGLRIGLTRTKDFSTCQPLEYATQVDVKNGAMFPGKLDGDYLLLHRPCDGASIWLSRSKDLEFWGEEVAVMTPRGGFWDSDRIGAAAPPIAIEQGWLLIYYGQKATSAGPLVRLGAAVLDRDDPARVLGRSNIPILSPRERYERIGDIPNVVFSCGALLEEQRLTIYYGASDSCICRGEARLEDILDVCREGEGEL
jgi:predicted GH43/DUF377 family glycosyl hydrolase